MPPTRVENLTSIGPADGCALTRCSALVLFSALLLSASVFAQQARPIVIEWNQNNQQGVAGYVVYVGSASGVYSEARDVGNETSFVYADAIPGRWYYFAVATYSSSGLMSEPSGEVPAFASATGPTTSSSVNSSLASAAAAPKRSLIPSGVGVSFERAAAMGQRESGASSKVCFDASQVECFRADFTAHVARPVSSLSTTRDGRLFFIEDGQYVRIVGENTLITEPALTSRSAHVRLEGLTIDPDFDRTRSVYVGEVETLPGGRRELSIIRYRELQDALGEGVAIVAGLAIPPDSQAPFTVDSLGRLYVAMPSAPGFERSARYAYGGTILQFNPDGTTPSSSASASPILARGFQSPSGLAWDSPRHQLWLSGSDTASKPLLARLPLDDARSPGARTSLRKPAVSIVPDSPFRLGALGAESETSAAHSSTMFLLDPEDRLVRVELDSRTSSPASRLDAAWAVTSVAVAPNGVVYLAVHARQGFDIFTLGRAAK